MGMNINMLAQVLLKKAANDPNFQRTLQNDPMKRNMFNALKNGDVQKGQELANNFCNSCGVSKEQMTQDAQNFFSNKFGGMM